MAISPQQYATLMETAIERGDRKTALRLLGEMRLRFDARASGGRPLKEDDVAELIAFFVGALEQSGSISPKIVPEIADAILAWPRYLRTYREALGPDAHFYIDPDTGEEDFDADMELEPLPVPHMDRATLRKRVRRYLDRKKTPRKTHAKRNA